MPLTAQQIVTLACQTAKCPGFTLQGGQYLNVVLNDLCIKYDLKMNRVPTTITAQAGQIGPFPLPADYRSTYDLFYNIDGEPYQLDPCTQEQYDAYFQSAGEANYPYAYMTDLSQVGAGGVAQLWIYPQSTSQLILNHRYEVERAEITNPQTSSVVPWFPDQKWLIKAVAAELMELTDDTRIVAFRAWLVEELRQYLIIEEDERGVLMCVKLDPRRFRSNRSLKPTKITD